MQVSLPDQQAELTVSLEGIQDEMMTLAAPSSVLDANTLIDLTEDFDDASQAPLQGQLDTCLLFAFEHKQPVIPLRL